MKIGKIILLILGIVGVFVAFGLLLGGGTLIWFDATAKDDEGFYTTDTLHLKRDSSALVSSPANITVSGVLMGEWKHLTTFRIEGASNDRSRGIFIGIAKEEDIQKYLADARYDTITELEIESSSLNFERVPGTRKPPAPTSQPFWARAVHGTGAQDLLWELEDGTYLLVFMNEDGSPFVDISVRVGAKVPSVLWIGAGGVAGGFLALAASSILIYAAVRRTPPEWDTAQTP